MTSLPEPIRRVRAIDGPSPRSDKRRSQIAYVGSHAVGPGFPPFVVAEIGVNHDGEINAALELIDAAAEADVQAVKFQMFDAQALVGSAVPTARYQSQNTGRSEQRALLAALELNHDDWWRVVERCQMRGVLFMATPFGVREVDRLVDLHPCALKIASPDLVDELLLARACQTDLPLILSTGASTEPEMDDAVRYVRQARGRDDLILLHCVSCYPTPPDHANLRAIETLHQRFDVPVGFSDHTTSVDIAAWAVCAGACLLEKHFTLNRNAPGPDHVASLDPTQLAGYVRHARQAHESMGTGQLGFQAIEEEVRRLGRKSIVATGEIRSGEKITAQHLTAKRMGAGLSPQQLHSLIGRRARVDIPADAPITWGQVE